MAFPAIIFDNTNGSDTAASGAGPGDGTTAGSALTGTAGATDATGLIVTLDSGTVLTSVATDGSHCIYFADATAGKRNFGRITASAGSGGATPTVTVDTAFALSASGKSWAIGGKRKTFDNTNSRKLWENNSSTGDAKGGWRAWSVSGDTQTTSSTTINVRNVEDTNGAFIWGTQPGYTTKATWVCSANLAMWTFRNSTTGVGIQNVIHTNSNVTKTASSFASSGSGGMAIFEGVEVTGSGSNQVWRAFRPSNGNGTCRFRFYNCRIENCASHGVGDAGANQVLLFLEGCTIKNNGGWGIAGDGNLTLDLISCIVSGNTSGGVQLPAARTVADSPVRIQNCTIHGNTGDNIQVTAALANAVWLANLRIVNNFITGSGGYGINFSGAGMTAAAISAYLMRIHNNVYGTGVGIANSSGWCNLTLTSDVDVSNTGVDPQYVNAGTGDFTPTNTALKGTAFPTLLTNPGGITNYQYPGAIQPNSTGGAANPLQLILQPPSSY